MPQDSSRKIRLFFIKTAAALMIGVVAVAALLYWHGKETRDTVRPDQPLQSSQPLQTAPIPRNEAATEPSPGNASGNMSLKETFDAQDKAAAAAVTAKPVSGKMTERPEFVTEIEWQVLRDASMNHPEGSGESMSDLANKLLFFKKKEAWLSAGENTPERRELARQLLDMIPGQLESNSIDEKTAKEVETKLMADL